MLKRVFIGRKEELKRLTALHQKKTPSLVVIKGRQRVGKSKLVTHFASQYPENGFWNFTGLAPKTGRDDQSQRDHFAHQLAVHLQCPPFTCQDWADAFLHLSRHLKPGDIVLLDDISWLGSKDPSFIPKLTIWWQQQRQPIMVILCGSVSTWIADNILKNSELLGHIHLTIALEPLLIADANRLLRHVGFQGSDYDAYKIISILGGIPGYLEQIPPGQTVDDLIKQLCFEKDSFLVPEFERIFHHLCHGKGVTYKKILDSLKKGMQTLADIRKTTGFAHSGTLSGLMEHLITAGFVQKQTLWSFKTNKPLKQSLYRIDDLYLRFYLKLIEPQRNKIEHNGFQDVTLSGLPGFEAYIGLQIKQLLLQNSKRLLKSLDIRAADIIASGPFRQAQTTTKAGCHISFLVQTVTNNLFVCEFKFRRKELEADVITAVQQKVHALKVPRGFAKIPVLFHIGGVSNKVARSDYFYKIIDITDFLHEYNEERLATQQPDKIPSEL